MGICPTSALSSGFNRLTQHLDSSYREEDVAGEAKIENILHRTTISPDVGIVGRRAILYTR